MNYQASFRSLATALAAGSSLLASAQFYAASGSGGITGSLYTINQANGAVISTVGTLSDASGRGYGMTGMVFLGGTLYGATSNASPTNPGWLVTIDPNTAAVTPIGAFGSGFGTMSDITVVGGTLYGWHASGDHSLYAINTATGAGTLVGGGSGNPGYGGGGLAANSAGIVYASPNAVTNPPGNLYTVNTTTGGITLVGPHTGLTGVINSMQFIGSTLYGMQSDQAGNTQLATINTATGAVTLLGPSAANADAIAFNPVPEPASLAALSLGGLALLRRRRANK